MQTEEQIKKIITNIETASKNNDTALFSKTRDVFQARLDTYVSRTKLVYVFSIRYSSLFNRQKTEDIL